MSSGMPSHSCPYWPCPICSGHHGYQATGTLWQPPISFAAPLANLDVERIARRVVELLKLAAADNATAKEAPAFIGTVDELVKHLESEEP